MCYDCTYMSRNSKQMDIVNGPLLKNIIIFALPLMATNLLQMMFNAADSVIVGKFAGEHCLAAVGATSSLIFLFTSLFNGLATGTNVIVARAIGSGDEDKIRKACRTSIMFGMFGGLFLMAAVFFFAKPLLTLMSTPSDIIDLSVLYMRIYFVGAPFILTYNFGAAILRAKGDTRRPLYFLAISGGLNVILNYIFVVFLNMTVSGVALATVISQAVSCFLVMASLSKENDATRVVITSLEFDVETAGELLRIGIPAGLQGMAFSLTNVVVQSSINSFGSSAIVAGNTAANNLENFIYIGMMAFMNATITFTSQCLGAGRKDRILPILFMTLILDMASAVIVATFMYLNGSFFLSFFTDSKEVIEMGMLRLFYVGIFLFLNGALDVLGCSMRGMGYSSIPMFVMFGGIIGVRMLWLLYYFPLHRTLATIYMCFPISWLVTMTIDIIIYIPIYRKVMRS